MASVALGEWTGRRAEELDQLAAAHQAVAGTGPGRRYRTRQINHAYLLAIAAQFQGFARDLHSEAADALVQGVSPEAMQLLLRELTTAGRDLDSRNAHPEALRSDFRRLGIGLWVDLEARYKKTDHFKKQLTSLNQWRNAIAHDDFGKVAPATAVNLPEVRGFRSACNGLAGAMDAVVGDYLRTILGSDPW